MPLNKDYPAGFKILERLFGTKVIEARNGRMNEIYKRTETIWQNYIKMIPRQTGVKYLLLAEAPPWSESGPPQFVLDPASRPSVLINAIYRAFFDRTVNQAGVQTTLEMLAERGFLIIDTLPFAMPYKNKRRCAAYTNLVAECCQSYLQDKIRQADLLWSDEVKIAFAFKINGQKVTESLNNIITLGNENHILDEDCIAVNRANYPAGDRLREIYELI